MKLRARTIVLTLSAFVASALYAFAQQPPTPKPRYTRWWLPDQLTESAAKVDTFFMIILVITGVVFIGVFVVMIYFLWKYRSREGGRAKYYHGNNKLEIFWTAIPAIILLALGVLSAKVWSEMKMQQPEESKSLVIEVSPRQFQWDIRYAGADGKFGTDDDLTYVNTIHAPAGKDVILKMSAQDVIHSFFIPEFRQKQDAVPGLVTTFYFNCPKPDSLQVACAELCGLGHGKMSNGALVLYPQAQYDAWYAEELAKKDKEMHPAPAAASTPPAASAPAASGDSAKTAPPAAGDTAKTGTN